MEKSSQSGEATNKVRMIHTSYYLLVCFYRQLIPFSHFRFTSNHFPFCFHNISVEENKVILIPKRLFKSDWLLVTNNGRARSTLRLEQKTNMTNEGHQLLQESALLVWNSINFISWRMEKNDPRFDSKSFWLNRIFNRHLKIVSSMGKSGWWPLSLRWWHSVV